MLAADLGQEAAEKNYIRSARKLIDCVLNGLGTPRSEWHPMAVRRVSAIGGYKGLRSGKRHAASSASESGRHNNTDHGRSYDGMYWHYLNKFIFVMVRYAQISCDAEYFDKAVLLAKELHEAFLVPGRGYRVKMNIDLTPVSKRIVHPTHGAVQAWVLFNIINCAEGMPHRLDVTHEIRDLEPIVRQYFMRAPRGQPLLTQLSDPLGLGQHLWTMQWLGDEVCGVDIKQYKDVVYHRAQALLPQAYGTCFPANADPIAVATGSDESPVSLTPDGDQVAADAATAADDVVKQDRMCGQMEAQMAFRLYGALLGAQLTAEEGLEAMSDPLVEEASRLFLSKREEYRDADMLAINTVMLASALNNKVFARFPNEHFSL